ncbi:hypothetical protein EH223_07735 [candidate division KSB1 bacterium]|nr:hypothetical protein [candidate division KSB1 bacterium]RQW04270.1 MAG: hypothetical protein EH223_07735 [candidate division KSB1 bacterium]
MKIKKRNQFKFLIIATTLFVWGCEHNQSTLPNQIWDKEDTITLDFATQGLPALKILNYYGGLIIYGHSYKQKINISANRRVESPDQNNLDMMLAGITVPIQQDADTVYLQVETPVAQRYEKYACGLNIFIPYGMPVFIDYAKNAIITNELDSLVHVRNAKSRILLARHNGSADLEAQSHINLEIYKLWPHGFINAVTDSGDVNMVLPEQTDATILAQSFYHPIELINIELDTFLKSYYTASGILGTGDAPIHLKTTYGTIRIKID